MSVPLQIYDFIAVIFPAVLILVVLKQEIPGSLVGALSIHGDYGGLAISFVLLYLLGQATTVIANRLERWKISQWIFRWTKKNAGEGQISLHARKTDVIFAEDTAQAILDAGVCVAMEQKTGISDPVYVCLLMGCSSVTSRSYRKFHQQNIK